MHRKVMKRAEAKELGLGFYFTGKPCKRGHVTNRRTGCGSCVDCASATTKAWQDANPDRLKLASQRWYSANPEKSRQKTRAWHEANREKSREASRNYRAANAEKMRHLDRAWAAANPEKKNAINAKRRAAKHNATPAWADIDEILSFYEEAARLTAATGIDHHVDHIVPLQGGTVCGLHVTWNLRVIPARENLAKKNLHWPDMWPDEQNVPITEAGNANEAR